MQKYKKYKFGGIFRPWRGQISPFWAPPISRHEGKGNVQPDPGPELQWPRLVSRAWLRVFVECVPQNELVSVRDHGRGVPQSDFLVLIPINKIIFT